MISSNPQPKGRVTSGIYEYDKDEYFEVPLINDYRYREAELRGRFQTCATLAVLFIVYLIVCALIAIVIQLMKAVN